MSHDAALTARADASGRATLIRQGVPLATATGLAVRDPSTEQMWAFGADDRAVQHQTVGGVKGWRIVRDGLDVRLVLGLPPDGNAAVFRLDVTNTGTDRRTLALESAVDAVGGGMWDDVAVLHARTIRVADGLWLAHTFVPDDGQMPDDPDRPVETSHWDVSRPPALRRTFALASGETAGWTVCLGVGDTARSALGAAFPHLSGQRSRAALAAAKAEK